MTERHEFFIKGRRLLRQPFHYAASGLPNVYLLNGVKIHPDEGYGASFEIEDIDGLHDAIAAHIVERAGEAVMKGPELRFLRKRMNKTQRELAKLLRVSDQTVANYEKDVTTIPGPADYSIRLHYLLHVLPPDAGRAVIDALTRLISEPPHEPSKHIVPRRPGIWDDALVAA